MRWRRLRPAVLLVEVVVKKREWLSKFPSRLQTRKLGREKMHLRGPEESCGTSSSAQRHGRRLSMKMQPSYSRKRERSVVVLSLEGPRARKARYSNTVYRQASVSTYPLPERILPLLVVAARRQGVAMAIRPERPLCALLSRLGSGREIHARRRALCWGCGRSAKMLRHREVTNALRPIVRRPQEVMAMIKAGNL